MIIFLTIGYGSLMLSIYGIPRDVIFRGLKTAIVVGSILMLINQNGMRCLERRNLGGMLQCSLTWSRLLCSYIVI